MALSILNNLLRIAFVVLLQCLVVNRMLLFDGFVLPWVYLFGILMLPFETPRWLTLFIAFAVGLVMDYFTGPMGLHTSACVLLGFLQPIVQRLLSPREGYDALQRPTVQRMGLTWYLTYAGLLTLAHHAWLFFFQMARLSDFFYQLFHILLSAVGTLLLMVVGQYLIYSTKKSEL